MDRGLNRLLPQSLLPTHSSTIDNDDNLRFSSTILRFQFLVTQASPDQSLLLILATPPSLTLTTRFPSLRQRSLLLTHHLPLPLLPSSFPPFPRFSDPLLHSSFDILLFRFLLLLVFLINHITLSNPPPTASHSSSKCENDHSDGTISEDSDPQGRIVVGSRFVGSCEGSGTG